MATIPKNMVEIVEGTARMLYDEKEAVFYNKVQVFNRDVSIQVIKLFSETITKERKSAYDKKVARIASDSANAARVPFLHPEGISVLDALAATGLRSIRYTKEIPHLRHITINDLSSDATNTAIENCKTNGVSDDKFTVTNRDACILMYEHRDPLLNFDVIDLDPYGSVSPFLDSAVQAVSDGGLLCVTCTDMPVLAGNYPEVCFAKYGSMPLKASYAQEMALRVLLNSIETAANRYKRYIVPWLSLSVDFYVRVFVRVFESPAEVKNSCLKRVMCFQSVQCPSFYTQPIASRNLNRNSKHCKKTSCDNELTSDNIAPDVKASGSALPTAALSVAPSNQDGSYAAHNMMPIAFLSGLGDESNDSSKNSSGMSSTERWKVGGPFWGQPIHDQNVVDELLRRVNAARLLQRNSDSNNSGNNDSNNSDNPVTALATDISTSKNSADSNNNDIIRISTAERLTGVLTSVSEELKDVIFYYSLPDLASAVQTLIPTHLQFKSALINAGYRVSTFHYDPSAFKTDAPNYVVWDIMRGYCKAFSSPLSQKKKASYISQRILSKECTIIADFTVPKVLKSQNRNNNSTVDHIVRYPPNPEANWGPKRRAGRAGEDEVDGNKNSNNKRAEKLAAKLLARKQIRDEIAKQKKIEGLAAAAARRAIATTVDGKSKQTADNTVEAKDSPASKKSKPSP